MSKLVKIYYIPGMISLFIIPFLFVYLSKPAVIKSKEKYLDIRLPTQYIPDMTQEEYMETYNTIEKPFIPIKGWNYKKIIVSKNIDSATFKTYLSELKEMQKRNIKNTGIQFIFQKETTYNDFISIYNIMIKAKQEFFGFEPITNSLYVLHIYTKPIDEKTEPCLLCDDLIIHEDNSQRNYIREIFFSLKKLPKGSYLLIGAFTVLCFISFLYWKQAYIKKENK